MAGKSGVRVVHNRLLGGWYVVRGSADTPLSGRFNSKAEATTWLHRNDTPRDTSGFCNMARTVGSETRYCHLQDGHRGDHWFSALTKLDGKRDPRTGRWMFA